MYKIRITGMNIPKAVDGMETTCPEGKQWSESLQTCVPIPGFTPNPQTQAQLKSSNKPITGGTGYQQGTAIKLKPLNKLKNAVGSYVEKTPTGSDVALNMVDPSGISNLPFLNQSIIEATNNPSFKTIAGLTFDLAGSIPIGGMGFRDLKHGSKTIWKGLSGKQKIGRALSWPVRTYRRAMELPGTAADRLMGFSTPATRNIFSRWNRGERFYNTGVPAIGQAIDDYQPSSIEPKYAFGGPHSEIPSLFSTEPDRLHKAMAGGEGYYQVGGVRQNCGEGYKWDDLSKQCIVDPNYAVQGKSKGLVNTPASGFSKDYQTMTMVPSMSTEGMQTFDWTTGNTDIQGNSTAAPMPANPNQETLYKLDANQTGPQVGLFNQKKPKSKTTGAGLVKAANDFSQVFDSLKGIAQTYSDIRNANQAQKEFDRTYRQSRDPFFRYANVQDPEGSRGFFQTNTGKNPEAGFKTVGEDGGTMLTDTDMNKVKIRITGGPNAKMAYGGQSGYGFDLGQRNTYAAMPKGKIQTVSSTIQEVPREEANIEAEKGETVYADVDGDGVSEHMNIEGKRHVDGGTPLSVPEGSFVFSDTKKMIIKDEAILAKFGMAPRKQGYTPAEIAKKYDINKYKAIIEDENSDSVMKNTAQLMVKNYQKKLAELALVQEQIKGFPQGIPQMCYGVLPDEMLQALQAQIDEAKGQSGMMSSEQEQQAAEMMGPGEEDNGIEEETPQEQMSLDEEYPEEMYGGSLEYGGSPDAYFDESDVNEYAEGGNTNDDPNLLLANMMENSVNTQPVSTGVPYDPNEPNNLVPWSGDKFENKANKSKYSKEEWAQKLRKAGYTGPLTNEAVQKWLYEQPKSKAVIDQLHQQHGMPKSGMFDKILGYRWDNALEVLDEAPPADESVYGYKCTGRDANNNPKVVSSTYINVAARNADGAVASEQEAYKQCQQTSQTKPGDLNVQPGGKSKAPFGYMTPDLWKMGAAAAMKGRKFLPYIADTAFEPGKFQKEDWYSKASQLQSLGRQAGEQIGAFKSGQASAADISNLAANQAENLIGAIADVDARNVRGVNAFNQAEQDRKDKFNLLRSANATERSRGNAIANQAWDNFINKKMSNVVDTASNAWENRMKLGLVNATNKFYYTDPRTGRTVFKGGYGPDSIGQKSGNGWAGVSSDFASAQQAIPGLTVDQYIKMLGKDKTESSKFGGSISKKKKSSLTDLANMMSNGYSFPF